MLQVFAIRENEVQLCSERLIAMQPDSAAPVLTLLPQGALRHPGLQELAIDVRIEVPAELTVSVYSAEGALVRRLASSQLSRPSADHVTHFYWDGRDTQGCPVEPGVYTVTAETRLASGRLKAAAQVFVGQH